MDGTQTPPSRRDHNGDEKCIGVHLTNGGASPLLVKRGDSVSYCLGENGIGGEETEVPCAERRPLPLTTKEAEKTMKCESSLGVIGDGLEEPLARPSTIEEQCVTISDLCGTTHCPATNGTQTRDEATALENPVNPPMGEDVRVDSSGNTGSDLIPSSKGDMINDDTGSTDSKRGDTTLGTGESLLRPDEAVLRVEDGQEREDGLVLLEGKAGPVWEALASSDCAGGEVRNRGEVVRGGDVEHSSPCERCCCVATVYDRGTETTSQMLGAQVLTHEEASRVMVEKLSKALEQLKADNERLQQCLSESSVLHEEKTNALKEALKDWELKCIRHQESVESSERLLKEERDRNHGLQDRIESSECLLKEERDRNQGLQDRVESSERLLKEEKHTNAGHQTRVKSLEQLVESERAKAASKMAELEKALAAKTEKIATIQSEAQSEKEDLVSRLVVIEHEKKRADDDLTTTERKLKEAVKEQERLQASIKNLTKDITKAQSSIEKNAVEHQKQLSQTKEELNSLNIKLKWAQGKLKAETEAHSECKAQLAAMTKKYQSAKEEGEQIRADLKAMIKQYQESEEMRSNSLGIKLKKTEDELRQQEQEISDQHQLHQLTLKELELIKSAHQITQQECQQLKAKLSELNAKMSEQKAEMDEHIISVTKLKLENKRLTTKASGVDELTHQLESERSKVAAVNASLEQLQQSCEGMERELAQSKEKERELLAFSEKLSSANAELLTEKESTEAKVSSLMEERHSLAAALQEAQKARDTLQTELNAHREQSGATISDLSQQLASRSEAVEQLTLSLDDEREQNKALRKKNASNLKDLQKQLQQYQKRIEQLEASSGAEAPATLPVSLASRTSSHESLDDGVVVLSNQPSVDTMHHDDDVQVHVTQNTGALFRHLDHEKEVLVEKLCVLRKEVAKKQEKLEFYEEHITQLTEEIKKKSKIIQDFVVREECGAVASPLHDNHKVKRARKGGVMASVFTGKLHHNEMTFDLSLEINRKMQSVLEDALLKNIMLKENIDTLGNEIARLTSQQQQGLNNGR